MPEHGERTWAGLLARLIAHHDIDAADTAWVMDRVLSDEATQAQLAGFLIALRAKGETATEISGMAEVMLARAGRVRLTGPAVDVVGTGGDQAHTVNISTMSAVVVAAAGVPVVKHGNRAASSKCGAADLLEHLGVVIDLPPAGVEACLAEVGIGFCFAPVFHPTARHTIGVRRELGVPTAMNVLGPLTNPAQPPAALVGCADPRMAPVLAEVFARRGMTVLVVRGDDGLDELTTTTTSTVWLARPSGVDITTVDPAELGLPTAVRADLRGDDAAYNATVCHALLAGERGPVRDAVLLNAGAALAVADGFPDGTVGITEGLAKGMVRAGEAIDSGAGTELLGRWTSASKRLSA